MFLRSKQAEPLSDEELVERVRRMGPGALGSLWDRYAHLLFGVGMKYLRDAEQAKDLVVEVFGGLPELLARHEVKSFRPWIHAVVRNRCLMALRRSGPEVRMPEGDQPVADDQSEEAAWHEADLQQLESALSRLNDGQRECLTFFYLERNSYQQVARRTGFSVEQVRSHLQNGRRNLRLMLTHDRSPGPQRHADQNRPL